MKPSGAAGKLYHKKLGAAITGAGGGVEIEKSGFYKIKSIAPDDGSGFPPPDTTNYPGGRGVEVGKTYYLHAGVELLQGDAVYPVILSPVGFVRDIPKGQQSQSTDVSTQEDIDTGVRAYVTSPFTDVSGSISGFVDVDSEEQRTLEGLFNELVITESEHITRLPAKQQGIDFMLSRRETQTVGETAKWEDFPVIVESLQEDKPFEGGQPFNFNYKLDGARKPSIIYYKVEAGDIE
jgi:hypothetical protein